MLSLFSELVSLVNVACLVRVGVAVVVTLLLCVVGAMVVSWVGKSKAEWVRVSALVCVGVCCCTGKGCATSMVGTVV